MSGPIHTTCAYCGVGCGMVAEYDGSGTLSLRGDPSHPANYGRLCSKGATLGETLGHAGRILTPQINGESVSWNQALGAVAGRFRSVIDEHGPEAVAFYVSGQLLTEDYYLANKLMKGFIGSANIDTNSRLCMASSVAGHKRAFGEDVVPGNYQDFEIADLVILVGSNLAWCHPVLHQRLLAAREEHGTRIVVIDPRQTATTQVCDQHLAIRPGSDVALFNGLLRYLEVSGSLDDEYIQAHTEGFDAARALASEYDPGRVAALTEISVEQLMGFYQLFVDYPSVVTVYSQGVNQSSSGTDKVNAIINTHLATGRIAKPGCGPLSVTGQPNAMGGRETGGLANMLAAHIDFNDTAAADEIGRFWRTDSLATQPGLKAVDMFDAVRNGNVKALWVMATNPAVSMPDTSSVREALTQCPFVVVSDVLHQTDTAQFADVLLPAAAWGEKDGTVTNSERRISRQRAFKQAPGSARPDWWIIAEVAKRMGYASQFDFAGPHAVFEEYAAMTEIAAHHGKQLDLSGLAGIDRRRYDNLQPFHWPRGEHTQGVKAARLFGDGVFSTASGRARFVATEYRAPATAPTQRFPITLTSGRIRDQWHTMTRSGQAPRLSGHIAEPYVELHPRTASEYGIEAASLVRLCDTGGHQSVVRALITERVNERVGFVPMHWSSQCASEASINDLFPAFADPVSGQPELKHTTAQVEPFPARWYGFAISRNRYTPSDIAYWARMRTVGGWRMELAHDQDDSEFETLFRHLCGPLPVSVDIQRYRDDGQQNFRYAAFDGDRLLAVLYLAPTPVAVSRKWLCDLFGRSLNDIERGAILAGGAADPAQDEGALICSCHGVGVNRVHKAITDGARTLKAIGEMTSAGTGCGSCRMELGRMLPASRTDTSPALDTA